MRTDLAINQINPEISIPITLSANGWRYSFHEDLNQSCKVEFIENNDVLRKFEIKENYLGFEKLTPEIFDLRMQGSDRLGNKVDKMLKVNSFDINRSKNANQQDVISITELGETIAFDNGDYTFEVFDNKNYKIIGPRVFKSSDFNSTIPVAKINEYSKCNNEIKPVNIYLTRTGSSDKNYILEITIMISLFCLIFRKKVKKIMN